METMNTAFFWIKVKIGNGKTFLVGDLFSMLASMLFANIDIDEIIAYTWPMKN